MNRRNGEGITEYKIYPKEKEKRQKSKKHIRDQKTYNTIRKRPEFKHLINL